MICGHIERVSEHHIFGWAMDDSEPAIRLTVKACLGACELGRTGANIPRTDLKGLFGRNDGAHGFTIVLESRFTEQQRAEITAEAALPGSDEWRQLPRYSPDQVREPQSAPGTVALSSNAPAWANDGFWSDHPSTLQIADKTAFPVFVIGSMRSGTTAISAALREATRYRGFVEGHVFDVAARVVAEITTHLESKRRDHSPAGVATFHLGQTDTLLRLGVQELLKCTARGYTTPFWVDKTQTRSMILSVPILAETWPNANFIFMKRRGLENVMSRGRRMPNSRFTVQCTDWAEIMADWRTIRPSIPGRFLELEQRALLVDPAATAQRVGVFLGLDAAEIEALITRLRVLRTEVTDPSARTIADIAETGWSADMIETFRVICGPEMEAYGYTYDGLYSK